MTDGIEHFEGRANCLLRDGIRCCLVGFFEVGNALLVKARRWYEAAIEECEIPRHYFHGGTESSRHENLALCNWLIESRYRPG